MDRLPPEIEERLARLAGTRVALLYEGADRSRATVIFESPQQPPLTLTLDGVRDVSWGFASPPQLRVPWRYSGGVRAVRLATVRSFGGTMPGAVSAHVRVEVDIEGSPTLSLEGHALTLGPVNVPVLHAPPSLPGTLDVGMPGDGLLN